MIKVANIDLFFKNIYKDFYEFTEKKVTQKVFHLFGVNTALANRRRTIINFDEIFSKTRKQKSDQYQYLGNFCLTRD